MLKSRIAALVRNTSTIFRVLPHPRAPTTARVTAALVIGYVCSPIQLIPTFIPVIGQPDDLFVVAVRTVLVRRVVDRQFVLECSLGGT